MTATSTQVAEDVIRRFAAALRSGQLYSSGHPIVARNIRALAETVTRLHQSQSSVVIGVVGDELIVDETPAKGDNLGGLVRRLKHISVERVSIDRGATPEELASLIEAINHAEPSTARTPPSFPALTHIRVGRIHREEEGDENTADIAAFKQMYMGAVSVAETLWESARLDKQPDATQARSMVDGLAEAVSQNRTALLALTTLKKYDDYTFTHMVNVSILTMGQARALGIEGALLREFGLAGLMHDIGKVRTPHEILTKPAALTEEEFSILRRHPVDGAEILRATPDMPTLAPVVAFEHHLRVDGSGYPTSVKRDRLNLATMLCSIADVYDAMRSQRSYQQAHPSERIVEVLKKDDGQQFDRHLVRRFVQLIGIYPAGSLVRLSTGEIAVVATIYAPDPNRPHVKLVIDRHGKRLETPIDINLWEPAAGPDHARTIVGPVDSENVDVDALALL